MDLPADGVPVRAGDSIQLEVGVATEATPDLNGYQSARSLPGVESLSFFAGRGDSQACCRPHRDCGSLKLSPGSVVDADGQSNEIATCHLEWNFRLDKERTHGFDMTDTRTKHAIF